MPAAEKNPVDAYIETKPPVVQETLHQVRSILRKALPAAVEVISYGIPAYKINGSAVVYFAGWKQHYSLYPAIGGLVAAFKKDLEPYKLSKGTIRFPLNEPIPAKLIERLAKFRAKEVTEADKARGALKKNSPRKSARTAKGPK